MTGPEVTKDAADVDTGNPPGPRERLIERVKVVAHSITHRVREALRHNEPLTVPTADARQTRPLRVLVVDDNPDAADALAAVVELLGCEVRACYDGATALEFARLELPDVCLLDIMMPGLDGVELAGLVRAQAGSRPIL